MDAFRDVPEFFEVEIGESLVARTETLASFRELGPPDLCHVIKSTGRAGQKDIGSYHYVSGVDASSSASLAAYLNSLTYAVEDSNAWFSKSTAWKVRSGCYCCFNAFSRVDIRVDVKIPGGVNAYVIDVRGERHEATPELWQETYLSAVLRAILYADDANYRLAGYRKLDPITSPDAEIRFLQTAEALFMKGWQLGSDPEIQVASVVSNHLTSGILKYFGDSYRYDQAVNLFEKIFAKDSEVASLLAKAYIGMNEEVKGLQVIAHALRENPQSYTLLHVQCDFLRSKGQTEWAAKLARQAVNCAPSEFATWAKLTEVYIGLGMFESALLTLNSCPMFTYNERDLHRMPAPARTHLPTKQFIADSGILEEDGGKEEVDVALLRLPAPGLRGTFAQAYALLTRLVAVIGWDELLKTRSAVFVMEEEYRAQKAQSAMDLPVEKPSANGRDAKATPKDSSVRDSAVTLASSTEALSENGSSVGRSMNGRADDNASTIGITSPTERSTGPQDGDKLGISSENIPTIKVSSESDREQEHLERSKSEDEEESSGDDNNSTGGEEDADGQEITFGATAGVALEKPTAAAAQTEDEGTDGNNNGTRSPRLEKMMQQDGFSFSNKRLCERWLDNLFMVLYEDLRIWTIFRAEVAHYKTQHVAYRKTGSEWEILGELGLRLQHKEEAKEAFLRCLDNKFSAKAWTKLLEMYAEEGDLQRSLNAAIRLTAYQHRWYQESAYPTAIAHYLFKLGQTHGHQKISYTMLSMGLPEGLLKLMEAYLDYGKMFKVEGYDY
ncbi:hypothetical protein FRB98_000745 [Tulasnella sp. 332]|nr:hypothetical protein FRB98_000745 [Tulasnella sp. 332]